ncbi:MAG: DsrE family protein [Nitrospirae bacterium]|nr:DsrE family protein [Nitrospirota bacterium]MBF0539965.1 DsrE family protein [Nitrospirota bacterium]
MATIKKLLFLVDKPPYKSENSRLALTHAIASQTVEIHLEDEDNVEPVLAFVGDGVLNCIKGQKALDAYGITSLEAHIKNALLLDLKVIFCKEDLDKFGLTEDNVIMDAEDIGGDMIANILPFADILGEMEAADHILHF